MEFKREPIFSGAIRSLIKAIGVVLGIAIGVAVAAAGFAIVVGPNYLPPKSTSMIMPDVQGNRDLLPATDPAILCIDFRGEIGMGDLTSEKIINLLLDSQEDMLKGRVKGVFLCMDSPGG